jgi:hypothetical protein
MSDHDLSPMAARRSSWPLLLPLAILVILVIGWSAFWFYAASEARRTIAGWLEREAAAGRLYHCGSQTLGGYPFRLEVRCADARAELRNLHPATSLSLGEVLIVAQVYQPTLLISEFSAPLMIAEQGKQPSLIANWTDARTSVRGRPQAPERVSVVLDKPTFDRIANGTNERVGAAEHAELHVRMRAGSFDNNPVLDLAVRLVAASAPGLHSLATEPMDADINTTLVGLKNFAPKSWPDRFREMQLAGGHFEIHSARVRQGEWLAVGAGSLGLTANGGLDGTLQLTVAGLDKLLQELGVDYLARAGARDERVKSALDMLDQLAPGLGTIARQKIGPGLAAGAALLGRPTELEGRQAVSLPLRFDDGVAFLGPLQIGRVQALF